MILDTLTLPSELIWVDEFTWGKVQSKNKRTIQGRMIIQENDLPSECGRLITLQSDNAWIKRVDLQLLRSWTDELNKVMRLTLNNLLFYDVVFRRWDNPCIDAKSLISTAFPDSDTYYNLTLKLMVF